MARRPSSVRESNIPVRRPNGQRKLPNEDAPSYGPCRNLDYELELAVWIGPGNPQGELSQPEYWDLREQNRSFTRLAAYADGSLTLTGSGRNLTNARSSPGTSTTRSRSRRPASSLSAKWFVRCLNDF